MAFKDKYKEKLGMLSSITDHRKKLGKQGRSPAPVDILADSLIPTPIYTND